MRVARKMGARYMECSSKEMTGVHEIFNEAITIVVSNDKNNQQYQQQQNGGSGQTGTIMKKKKRSCKIL